MDRYTCPGCRQMVSFVTAGMDLHRCSRCSWLCRLTDGEMRTRFTIASRPAKAKGVRARPTDLAKLDALLQQGLVR